MLNARESQYVIIALLVLILLALIGGGALVAWIILGIAALIAAALILPKIPSRAWKILGWICLAVFVVLGGMIVQGV